MAASRKHRLEATRSFIKMMTDIAERMSEQAVQALDPAPARNLKLIPVKTARNSRRPAQRPSGFTRLFS